MTSRLKTAEQYLESLRQLKLRVYFLGMRIENPADFPLAKRSQNAVAMTYKLAQDFANIEDHPARGNLQRRSDAPSVKPLAETQFGSHNLYPIVGALQGGTKTQL